MIQGLHSTVKIVWPHLHTEHSVRCGCTTRRRVRRRWQTRERRHMRRGSDLWGAHLGRRYLKRGSLPHKNNFILLLWLLPVKQEELLVWQDSLSLWNSHQEILRVSLPTRRFFVAPADILQFPDSRNCSFWFRFQIYSHDPNNSRFSDTEISCIPNWIKRDINTYVQIISEGRGKRHQLKLWDFMGRRDLNLQINKTVICSDEALIPMLPIHLSPSDVFRHSVAVYVFET